MTYQERLVTGLRNRTIEAETERHRAEIRADARLGDRLMRLIAAM